MTVCLFIFSHISYEDLDNITVYSTNLDLLFQVFWIGWTILILQDNQRESLEAIRRISLVRTKNPQEIAVSLKSVLRSMDEITVDLLRENIPEYSWSHNVDNNGQDRYHGHNQEGISVNISIKDGKEINSLHVSISANLN